MKLHIIAKNEFGKDAIKQHIEERKRFPKWNPSAMMYNKFFSEKIVSEDPFVLEVSLKNPAIAKAVKFEDLKTRIEESLMKNDATLSDYKITEVK